MLQAVYLKIFERKAVFDGRAAFKTWLFAVIRKSAAEVRRAAIGAQSCARLAELAAVVQHQHGLLPTVRLRA